MINSQGNWREGNESKNDDGFSGHLELCILIYVIQPVQPKF